MADATPDDAPWLAPAAARMFRAAFGDRNDPVDMDAYVAEAFATERVAAELGDPDTTTLLAHDLVDGHEQVVGYASLVVGAEPGIPGDRPVELRRLYVEPAITGRGHGARLLAEAVERARSAGHDVLWLGVWEHNDDARRFYRRHGFQEVGRHTFLLGQDRQTDLLMARTLVSPRPGPAPTAG